MRRKKNISRIIAAFIAFGVSIGFIAAFANSLKVTSLHAEELDETFTYASMSGTYLSYSLDQNGGANTPNTNTDIRIYNKNTLTFTANPAYASSIAITSVSITGKNSKNGNTQGYSLRTYSKKLVSAIMSIPLIAHLLLNFKWVAIYM